MSEELKLPPLPITLAGEYEKPAYTAGQMRAYAIAAITGDETGWEAMNKLVEYARKVTSSQDVHSVYEDWI